MKSLPFYLIILFILAAIVGLLIYKRKQMGKPAIRKQVHLVNFDVPGITKVVSSDEKKSNEEEILQSPYDANLIVLQINAFPGKPYMGYELHQALLSAGFRFGEMNLFHRYDDTGKGNIQFSLAAATPSGSFDVEDIGAFKCSGLLIFMRLDAKQKALMNSFDLMLDTARQLAEELGGDIYDEFMQPISPEAIKKIREKICTVETHNMYTSDLLDNLD